MLKGLGIDIERVDRFKDLDSNFLENVFTQREIAYCKSKKRSEESFAGKFCAKEATIKAIQEKMNLKSIEIINNTDGKPEIFINSKRATETHCSISHETDYAIAIVSIGV